MTRDPLPHDIEAERALLGAALLVRSGREVLAALVSPGDFLSDAHQCIASAVLFLHLSGVAVDAMTVSERLRSRDQLETVGGDAYLVRLLSDCPAPSSARRYAEIVADRAVRRSLLRFSDEVIDAARDLGRPLEGIIDSARERLGSVAVPVAPAEPDGTIDALLAERHEHDWLIPGLLERGDRLILTSREGNGKSQMLRQFALKAAAGIHPWDDGRVKPVSVLLVDCENGRGLVQRQFRPLREVLRRYDVTPTLGQETVAPAFDPDRLRVRIVAQGLDLLTRADQHFLAERVLSNLPELLIIGPLYKLYGGNPNGEEEARKVAAFLDGLRAQFGFALMMEAHSPHGDDLRPYGASLWRRWPEFGYGLQPVKDSPLWDLIPWRGAREQERKWPRQLRRGGTWPWSTLREEAPL